MTTLTYRPRPAWTDPETSPRRQSPFRRKATADSYRRAPMPLGDSEDLLVREAKMLAAPLVVVEVVAPERAFRLDGLMRADAKIDHPGVVVSLDGRHGPLRYATDTFDRWQDNLRAVALALEALRMVDRYGVTKRGEQYAGWKQLPGGDPVAVPTMSVEEAAQTLADLSGMDWSDDSGVVQALVAGRLVDECYRAAAKLHHPDRGGDRATWDRVDEAHRVLTSVGG